MGIDLLDINFRIEREFGVRIALRDLVHLVKDDAIHDPTAGELFDLLVRSLPEPEDSERTADDRWTRLQSIIAETCGIPASMVKRDARLVADLGCE
jgi:hypothetical protein